MADVLDVIFSMLVGSVGTILFVAWDERRLSPEQLDRAWPLSTRLAAAVAFGPLCIPVHFWRTRRTFLDTMVGVTVMLLFFAVIAGISALLEAW